MSVTGISYERAGYTRIEDLRRQAFVEAQARRSRGTLGARIAVALRALAARLDGRVSAASGPWREDFHPSAAGRA